MGKSNTIQFFSLFNDLTMLRWPLKPSSSFGKIPSHIFIGKKKISFSRWLYIRTWAGTPHILLSHLKWLTPFDLDVPRYYSCWWVSLMTYKRAQVTRIPAFRNGSSNGLTLMTTWSGWRSMKWQKGLGRKMILLRVLWCQRDMWSIKHECSRMDLIKTPANRTSHIKWYL
jgi:hypothetical protein